MQYYLSIKNAELLATIETIRNDGIDNKKELIDINEYLLNTQDINIKLILTSIVERYKYITEELQQTPLTACEIILQSNLSFNKRIPLHEVINSYDVNLSSTEKEIQRQIKKQLEKDKITVYYCDTTNDIYEAIIYHYSINGYNLRQCQQCGNCFFRNDKRGLYCKNCSDKVTQNNKNIKAKERLKDPTEQLIHKIGARLRARTKDKSYTNENFKNDLEEKRKLLKTNKITKGTFHKWVCEIDKKAR